MLKDIFKIPPIPGQNEFDIAGNKWYLNEFCRKNKLSYLKAFLIKNHKYNKSDLADFEGSVLLKPILGEGGLGIRFFKNTADLVEDLNEKAEYYFNKGYMLQEYIDEF